MQDWSAILNSNMSTGQLPPESELQTLLVQAPLFGSIVAMKYYLDHNIQLSEDTWVLAAKHNKHIVEGIPDNALTPSLIQKLIKSKANVLDILINRNVNIPADVLQLAVKKLPANITQIPNPPENLKLVAVSKNGELIKRLPNPSTELLNAALTEPKFIKNEKSYTKFVKMYFKDNALLMNKWLRYANNIRG